MAHQMWGPILVDQLTFYWDAYLWSRLDGLTDEEFFWEPVPGCWSLRPADDSQMRLDQTYPDPEPAPLTTIAWRIVHLGAYVLGNRANALFGSHDHPTKVTMFDPRFVPTDLPRDAASGLAFLERAYLTWRDGLAALTDEALVAPLGPIGGPFANDPIAALAAHLHRETMHHGGEIGVLRDLYRATGATMRDSQLTPTR